MARSDVKQPCQPALRCLLDFAELSFAPASLSPFAACDEAETKIKTTASHGTDNAAGSKFNGRLDTSQRLPQRGCAA